MHLCARVKGVFPGRVECGAVAVSWSVGDWRRVRDAPQSPTCIVPFPVPAYRTGRAVSGYRLFDWFHAKAYGLPSGTRYHRLMRMNGPSAQSPPEWHPLAT
jgi:hypothetical protein